jgi:hypothetical protein
MKGCPAVKRKTLTKETPFDGRDETVGAVKVPAKSGGQRVVRLASEKESRTQAKVEEAVGIQEVCEHVVVTR